MPNKSFKPNLPRYAGQVGLTQVLAVKEAMSRLTNLLVRAAAALALIAAVFAAIFYLVSNDFFGISTPGWAAAGVWIAAVLAIYHYLVAPAVRPYDQAWRDKRRARSSVRIDG